MTSYLEQILQKLLTPDSVAIKQATKQLLDYFVSDKCITGLLEVLKTGQITQNRIYAATLLRKKVKNWKSLKQNEQLLIKQQIIENMVKEPEESVRKQIMYLIASTYKYSFKSKQEWPDLFKLIQELITSPVHEQNLASMFILSILNEEAPEEMKPHYSTLLNLFTPILKNSVDYKLIIYALSSLKNIIPYVSSDELNGLRILLPDAITASIRILHSNMDKEIATCVFEFFHSLIEYEVNVVAPFLTSLLQTVLKVIEDQSLPNTTRICALNYVNTLVETQKITLIKSDMIRPIVNTIFTIMCLSNAPLQTRSDMEIENDDENENGEGDSENLFTCATQVLDYCALYFPAKKFIKILVEYVQPVVAHENALYRRAALAALAVTSEGCADHYRNHYLEFLVDLCIKGVFDSDIEVVSTAFFALCQFTEYLTPNITHYATRIMHVFIQYIEQNPQLQVVSRLTVRFYDALQSFCENLGEELETYIDPLMAKLMQLVAQNNLSLKLQRLIICTFSSIVTSIKANFEPYFDHVVQMIKPYLAASAEQQQDEQFELKLLQIECIDLMGILAKYMKNDKFTNALINDCLLFVQHVLNNDDDAEKRSAVYDLLAGLSNKLQENIPLQQLMPQIIETLRSEEGINIIDSDEKVSKDGLFSAFDEIDLEDPENSENENDDDYELIDDDDDKNKVVIENEHVAEKLSALYCLQEACKYQNPQFLEFYKVLVEETTRLTVFVHLHIRRESYLALAKLIIHYHDYCKALGTNINNQAENPIPTLLKDIKDFFGNSIKTIECEGNRQLVMSCFDSLSALLNGCSPFIRENLNVYGETLEKIGNIIIDAFKNKIFCQTVAQDDDGDDQSKLDDQDDNQAEYDYMIKEYAGDIVPALALCLPDDAFDKYFEKILQFLHRILNKSESSVAEKSFAIGVIGETVGNMNVIEQNKAVLIYKGLQHYVIDHDDEVRSNTIFTTGVLCSQSNGALKDEYEHIIKGLLMILNNGEKNKQVIDNICGTLCRICFSAAALNLPNIDYVAVLNKIFELTPLKTDHNEYFTFFSMVINLQSHSLLLSYFPKIIEISGFVLFNKHYECRVGIKDLILNFLNYVNTTYNQDLINVLDRMKFEYAAAIRAEMRL